MTGDLKPISGIINLNSNVEIAMFTQHHIDQLELGLTATQYLRKLFPEASDQECRTHLGRFGLIGELAMIQIGHLSGGQKSRAAMSIICWRKPHLLILDEPVCMIIEAAAIVLCIACTHSCISTCAMLYVCSRIISIWIP